MRKVNLYDIRIVLGAARIGGCCTFRFYLKGYIMSNQRHGNAHIIDSSLFSADYPRGSYRLLMDGVDLSPGLDAMRMQVVGRDITILTLYIPDINVRWLPDDTSADARYTFEFVTKGNPILSSNHGLYPPNANTIYSGSLKWKGSYVARGDGFTAVLFVSTRRLTSIRTKIREYLEYLCEVIKNTRVGQWGLTTF